MATKKKIKIEFIRNSYIRFYKTHKKEINDAIQRCLRNGDLLMRGEVGKFERSFAKFCKRKYCLSTSSGTDALRLAAKIKKLSPVDSYRYRLPKEIIDKRNGAFLVTYMNSVQSTNIRFWRKHLRNPFFVEDACQAAGHKLYGDISCFSFYPAKILGGLGRGGALVTNDKKIYDTLKKIRDDKWNNWWLEEIHAAFLNVKLKYLSKLIKRRQEIANYYNNNLPKELIYNKRCLQNYLVIVADTDKFIKYMQHKAIEVFPDKNDFYENSIPNAVRIPIYPEMTNKEVYYVINCIKKFYARA